MTLHVTFTHYDVHCKKTNAAKTSHFLTCLEFILITSFKTNGIFKSGLSIVYIERSQDII